MTKRKLIEENQRLKAQNKALQFERDNLKRLIFGQKSERFVPEPPPAEQLNLFGPSSEEQSPEASTEKITYERRKPSGKPHPGRHAIPDHLPVEEVLIEPEEDTSGLVKIGEERTEYVEYTPASLVKKVIIRPKYVRAEPDGSTRVLIGSLPGRPIDKSVAGASLLAWTLVSKFIDHLPFYRQIKRLERDYRWTLPKSTLGDWFAACCELLRPLYQHILSTAVSGEYLQGDESRIQVMSKERRDDKGKALRRRRGKPSKTKQTHCGWMWVVHSPTKKLVVFNYEKGRSTEHARTLLDGFEGYLQVDGYYAYNQAAARKGVTRVGCAAHIRRKFFEALNYDRKRSEYALEFFQKVYALEEQCRELPAEERKTFRQEHLQPLLGLFKDWLDEQAPSVLPKSPLGQAFTYAQNQWPYLCNVLKDGRLEIDNNLIENNIRPLTLGRKNFLFAGSHDAAQRIAIIYTLLGTCVARGVNPYTWLKRTLEEMPQAKLPELYRLVPGYEEEGV